MTAGDAKDPESEPTVVGTPADPVAFPETRVRGSAAPPPPPGPSMRPSVGPFRLARILGRGGMGTVYEGAVPGGPSLAVKVLHSTFANDEGYRRFVREAKIRVEHPNVVEVKDAGFDTDGTAYIAFELLEGESLETRLSRGTLATADAVGIAVQVCSALAAVHARGIVHRDLKPGNIYVCSDGRVKLLDFGVARATGPATWVTTVGSVIGTPSYLAPEQARGDGDVDARADLWALGVVFYHSLAGRAPFDRETMLATMLAVLIDEPAPLLEVAPTVPPRVAGIIERCLRKSRDERWASAEALGAALASADLRPLDPRDPRLRSQRVITAGEQRVVAILLADGVTDFGAIESAVRDRGGVLLKLAGQRGVGLFGGKQSEGDELARAAAAALASRAAAARMSVASGRARSAGPKITGAALNAAEDGCRAELGGVAIDAASARALTRSFTLREVQDGLCELVGQRVVSGLPSSASPGSITPTRGRTVELAQLRNAIDTVASEQRPMVVLVSGPPGIGKTRLAEEMERLAATHEPPFRVLVARAEPLRRGTALALVADALRYRASIGTSAQGWPRLDPEAASDEHRDALRELTREAIDDPESAEQCAEFLGELLAAKMPDSAALRAARSDPRLMADRLRVSLHEYFVALAYRAPLALLLEDLQWSDASSLDLLEELLARASDAPLLVMATARPELFDERPHLFAGHDLVRVEPRGLGASDVAALAADIVAREVPATLVRAVSERTGGNPLFVEQIVLALREEGRLDADVTSLPLPVTVEAAVQARLDDLAPAEKELCKVASLLARPFRADELVALGVTDARSLLSSLARRDIVTTIARTSDANAREYRFRSSLVSDVAYRMIDDEVCRDLHRRAAAFLAERPSCDAEEVGKHHDLAGDEAIAGEWYARAALGAARRGDGANVLRCSERAFELGVAEPIRFELHMARADAAGFLGGGADADQELAAAVERADTDAQRARSLSRLAEWRSRSGHPAESLEVVDEAVRSAERSRDPEALAHAAAQQAAALIHLGRPADARACLDRVATARAEGPPQIRAMLEDVRGYLAATLGDHSEQRDAYASAARLYAQSGDLRRAAGAEANLADAYNRVGAYAEAEQAIGAALAKARRLGNRLTEGYCLMNLGYATAMQGRTAEAVESLTAAGTIASGVSDRRLEIGARLYLARALVASRQIDEALREAERAATEADDNGLTSVRALALSTGARAHLLRGGAGDREAAVEMSKRALALRDELGGIEEDEAEVFLVCARALADSGLASDADAVRARGRARVEELAARIADVAWRERFVRNVAAHAELAGAPPSV